MPDNKPNIIIFIGASNNLKPESGTMISMYGWVESLRDDLNITLVADKNGRFSKWKKIPTDRIFEQSNVRYLWLSKKGPRIQTIRHLLKSQMWDIVILNSFFDREFTLPYLLMKKLHLIPQIPTLNSPRGELAQGALSNKAIVKKAYCRMMKLLGLTKYVWFHATAGHEKDAIEKANLGGAGVLVAPNPAKWFPRPKRGENIVDSKALNLAFLGRISPVKNLPFAIKALMNVKHPTRYHIFGPLEDSNHWEECRSLIEALPDHIEVSHKGSLNNDDVPLTLSAYDALFLPTQGENFGHAIHESLMSGIPVIISDQTPWRNLVQHQAGWDLALDNTTSFSQVIDTLASLSHSEKNKLRDSARIFAEKRWAESGAIDATKTMIETAIKNVR